jgi:hypothetical protein
MLSAAALPPAAADDYSPSSASQVRSCRSIAWCWRCCLPRRRGQEEGLPHDRPRTKNQLVVTSPSLISKNSSMPMHESEDIYMCVYI